jgi:hypothetical protein
VLHSWCRSDALPPVSTVSTVSTVAPSHNMAQPWCVVNLLTAQSLTEIVLSRGKCQPLLVLAGIAINLIETIAIDAACSVVLERTRLSEGR